MITEIADAAGQLIRLANDLPRETQTRRLEAAREKASDEVENFKADWPAGRMESLNLRLGGRRHGILVHVAVAE